MGLPINAVRRMIQQQARHPWHGPVVTLGVQDLSANYETLTRFFQEERQPFTDVPTKQRALSTSLYFQQTGQAQAGFVHARVFFEMLGVAPYDDLDFADFEQPTMIHDLNQPIRDDWKGRYGLVVDGGTIEHIFDVKTVFANIASLLAIGGDVLHISPLSGWINHGFFQLNPCLFFDFYTANGFEVLDACLIGVNAAGGFVKEFAYVEHAFDLPANAERYLFSFRARKVRQLPFRVPIQGFYRTVVSQSHKEAA